MKKNVMILIIFFMILIPNFVNASFLSEIFKEADSFMSSSNPDIDTSGLRSVSNDIYFVLLYIGIAVSVIAGAIMGIKMMMASAEEKAKIKELLIPYIVGCFAVFSAFGIWKVVVTVLNESI